MNLVWCENSIISGDAVFSLIAVRDGEVVGYALFSKLHAPAEVLALGPVAVTKSQRREGIGDAMIQAGLKQARQKGWKAVAVLGEPAYYQRFGFSREAVQGMSCRYSSPNLMGLVIVQGGLSGPSIEYTPAFSETE